MTLNKYDYLIVGAGISGITCANKLAEEKNKKILIIDRRTHIAGNSYDYKEDNGIMVHKYGPHIFHTNHEDVWKYLSRFTEWTPYEHKVRAFINNKTYPLPININTINELYGLKLNENNIQEYYDKVRVKNIEIKNSEDIVISKIGVDLYEKIFKYYTKKQWDLWPSELNASVAARIPVRTNRDDRYFSDKYQAMPKHGYTSMMKKMLDHKNIDLKLSTEFKNIKNKINFNKLIFTGCIDEYFKYTLGKLPYRSCRFDLEKHQGIYQECGVINYTASLQPKYTRITEYKYLNGQLNHPETVIAKEYSQANGEPYYAIPNPKNHELFEKYKSLAKKETNVYFIGRLAQYKYFNQDQACKNAIDFIKKIES